MLLYLQDSKDDTKKLRSDKHFGKIIGYKKIQKSVAFLCTNNEQVEKETRKTILFTVASKI
jgi:hypothetical protein